MKRDADLSGSEAIHQTCRRVVQALIKKNEWLLLSEDDLVSEVVASIEADDAGKADEAKIIPSKLKKLATWRYTTVLYQACQQSEKSARREQGYRELFRYVFRVACNRWPDLAESVAQRAIVLIFEQIDRCRNPATFLSFAFFKLLQAYKDELRNRGKEMSLDGLKEHVQFDIEDDQPTAGQILADREQLRVLLAAIQELPDQRQQQAVVLKFFGGFSDKEIAVRLQTTTGNVRVLRSRALKKLRQDEHLKNFLANENHTQL